jgi:dTDP-4-amino-4,6-dideoxygalactose transaminase
MTLPENLAVPIIEGQDPFKQIDLFEQEIADYCGSPYAVVLDCCTHAIELCLRYDKVKYSEFSAYTYISVLMTFKQLKIPYKLLEEQWSGSYLYHGTRIVDSARSIKPNMYKPGTFTCISFGRGKPMEIGHGGAILLDDYAAYKTMRLQAYDGRDLHILPWADQKNFKVGYHYKLSPYFCTIGRRMLANREFTPNQPDWAWYPDCRLINIEDAPE